MHMYMSASVSSVDKTSWREASLPQVVRLSRAQNSRQVSSAQAQRFLRETARPPRLFHTWIAFAILPFGYQRLFAKPKWLSALLANSAIQVALYAVNCQTPWWFRSRQNIKQDVSKRQKPVHVRITSHAWAREMSTGVAPIQLCNSVYIYIYIYI